MCAYLFSSLRMNKYIHVWWCLYFHTHGYNQHFSGSTGYGHDEAGGREALDQAFAEIVGAESALVRSQVCPIFYLYPWFLMLFFFNPACFVNSLLLWSSVSFSQEPMLLPVRCLHFWGQEMRWAVILRFSFLQFLLESHVSSFIMFSALIGFHEELD